MIEDLAQQHLILTHQNEIDVEAATFGTNLRIKATSVFKSLPEHLIPNLHPGICRNCNSHLGILSRFNPSHLRTHHLHLVTCHAERRHNRQPHDCHNPEDRHHGGSALE